MFLTNVKSGNTWGNPNLCIFDAVAIKRSWIKPAIIIYEIKTNHQDFLRDIKWPGYLLCCHRFFFVCPNGIIKKEEIVDPSVGLIWIDPEHNAFTVKKQAVFRNIEMPSQMFYHLVISHMKSDRYPFVSGAREYLELFVADKIKRLDLANLVKSKMLTRLQQAEEKLITLETKMGFMQRQIEEYHQIKEILAEHGVRTGWDIKASLKSRLDHGMDDRLFSELSKVKQAIDTLLSFVSSKG